MIGRLARILLVFLLALPAAARAETRALVVAASYAGSGNSALALANTAVDGRNVAAALTRAGLRDVRLIEDPDLGRWETELEAFAGSQFDPRIARLFAAEYRLRRDELPH